MQRRTVLSKEVLVLALLTGTIAAAFGVSRPVAQTPAISQTFRPSPN